MAVSPAPFDLGVGATDGTDSQATLPAINEETRETDEQKRTRVNRLLAAMHTELRRYGTGQQKTPDASLS